MSLSNVATKSFLFGMGLILAATQAFAQVSDKNTLDTLHFRTPENKFSGRFNFTPDLYYRTYSEQAGSLISTGMRTNLPFSLNGTYGITDLLSVNVSESYLTPSSRVIDHNSLNTSSNNSSTGFSDPTFGLSYRYLGGLEGDLFANASLSYSPSIGNAQVSTYPGGGNNLRGASTLSLSTTLYGAKDDQEWAFGGDLVWQAKTNSDGSSASNTTLRDAFMTYALRAQYRYHFASIYFIDALGSLNFGRSSHLNYVNQPALSQSDHFPFYVVPKLSFGVLATPECLFTLGISYIAYDRTYSQTQAGVVTQYDSQFKELPLELSVTYLF